MATELRRTHQEQVDGAVRDAAAAVEWLGAKGAYIEVRGKGREAYIAADDEVPGCYEAVIVNADRSKLRKVDLVGAIEWLQTRLA
jgi:hypothetical protein